MNNIRISVIIPAYNAEHTIDRAVGSLLIQDFDELEIIIVDDGSTDGTFAVCEELADSDIRIRLVRKENGGVSSARNAGLDVARGEYVMFLDADDVLHQGALGELYEKGLDLVVGGFEKVSGSSVTYSCRPSREGKFADEEGLCRFLDAVIARKHCYLLNSSCFKLYRRALLQEAGLRFDSGLDYGEDKIFVFSFLSHAEKVKTVDSVVYSYIIHEGSLSSDESSDRHIEGLFRLMETYAPVLESLVKRFPGSHRLTSLYHTDMIGRYVFRILTQFVKRSTPLLTEENLKTLYSYMARDRKLGVFSVRPAQIPNVLLYLIGKPELSMKFYRFISRR